MSVEKFFCGGSWVFLFVSVALFAVLFVVCGLLACVLAWCSMLFCVTFNVG